MAFAFVALHDRSRTALFSEADYARQRAFFAAHPELAPTPLRRFRSLGRTAGLVELHAKDETGRFGLNAFKAAGATFALAMLRERGTLSLNETLVCASEGNHGRAVARAARDAGCRARVYLADSVAASRVAAIEREGAVVVTVPGTYDDAVRVMSHDARERGWRVISDTSMPGDNDDVPRLIMLGYTRLMDEAEAQWQPGPPPDAIFVPGGVGGLLGAVADWTWSRFPHPRLADARPGSAVEAQRPWPAEARTVAGERRRPAIVCVEPASAACLQMSAREGRPTTLDGPFDTVMAGLRCGEVSRAAFETVLGSVDAYVAIEDFWAFEAMRALAAGAGGDPSVAAGASGAAALGGLLATRRDPALSEVADRLGLGPGSRVLVLITEAATDPELFAQVVGRPTSGHPEANDPEPK